MKDDAHLILAKLYGNDNNFKLDFNSNARHEWCLIFLVKGLLG